VGAKTKKTYIKDLKDNGIDIVFYSYFLAPLLRPINTQINYLIIEHNLVFFKFKNNCRLF